MTNNRRTIKPCVARGCAADPIQGVHDVCSGARGAFEPQPQPSPQVFPETVSAYQRTSALKAAIELDLLTAIVEGNKTADSLALRCQASQRGIRIVADDLTTIGFLRKNDSQYALTPDSAPFRNRHSPAYTGSAIGFLLHPEQVKAFADVAGAVRKGGTVGNGAFLDPENEIWITFAEVMRKVQTMTLKRIISNREFGRGPPNPDH